MLFPTFSAAAVKRLAPMQSISIASRRLMVPQMLLSRSAIQYRWNHLQAFHTHLEPHYDAPIRAHTTFLYTGNQMQRSASVRTIHAVSCWISIFLFRKLLQPTIIRHSNVPRTQGFATAVRFCPRKWRVAASFPHSTTLLAQVVQARCTAHAH